MRALFLAALFLSTACSAQSERAPGGKAEVRTGDQARPFTVAILADFDGPWAMAFLPDTGQALVTEQKGRLILWSEDGREQPVAGVPKVDFGGQGGLGDVVPHPDFATNNLVYLSWAEAGEGGNRGAVVGRARLVREQGTARLEGLEVIWRQTPKMDGRGHYGHRIAFSPDGHLFISSGERQEFDPAQDMSANLGKIIRLTDSGAVPADNPFHDRGGVAAQVWTLGHRNPLGIAFAADGRLWINEMGPKGGDEFNLIERGANYGYPTVSNGDHYDGRTIPDHDTQPRFAAPKISWTPVISPSSMIFYSGAMFPQWQGSALIGGLSGKALVRVVIDGDGAREADRWPMDARIREVEQGPDGAIYLLEDEDRGSRGRLLKLVPRTNG